MIYRKMTMEDLPQVAQIEADCFSQPWSIQGYIDTIKQEYAFFVVAQAEDGEIAGMCGIINAAGDGDISNVAVKSSFRKKGIAYHMMCFLMEESKHIGVSAYTLEVRAGNANAIALYEKCGFTSAGIRKNFYDNPREDALIMWKR